MTDLNTVFITGIPVLGSLLGALLGYVASIRTNNKSNKHALEIEKMRLEHETTMKEKERNRALLEELCSLVYGVQADIILPFIDNTSNTGLAVIASEKTLIGLESLLLCITEI